jgi:hypothetical protein
MTTLKTDRPLRRETAAMYSGRPLVVVLHGHFLEIGQKGRRQMLTVAWPDVFEFACKVHYLNERKKGA